MPPNSWFDSLLFWQISPSQLPGWGSSAKSTTVRSVSPCCNCFEAGRRCPYNTRAAHAAALVFSLRSWSPLPDKNRVT